MNLGSRRADALRALWVLASCAALACSDAREPPQPASFDRPTDVDFVCVRDGRVAPLSECDVVGADRALHALVTQSARGEVAAVNLRTSRILDNRRDVPGFTFVQTGELPVAIVASRMNPEITYVASYGSRDVRVMRTEVLLGLSSEAPEAQAPISMTMSADGGVFGGTPSDMVLLPDESALLVSLSDVGKVARLPLLEGGLIDESGITFVELATVAPPAPTPVASEDSYALICGDYERPPLPPIPEPRTPLSASAARPVAMAIDRSCRNCGDGRVVIADEALPVLHVLDIAALAAGEDALRAPIPTGAPTRDVVVTPRVPAAFVPPDPSMLDEDTENVSETLQPIESTYFVYAIDGTDGSVMVLEDDALLAINRTPGGRVDRLPIAHLSGSPAPLALALEVVTPDLPTNPTGDPEYVDFLSESELISARERCTDATHIKVTPRRLRGVFLTVALADGTVRVVDVHDRDLLNCRRCSNAPGEAAPVLVRHHPRLVTDPIAREQPDREELLPRAGAQVRVKNGVFNVRNNGSVSSPLAPQLACFACDDGLAQAFPDPKDQLGIQPSGDEDAGIGGDQPFGICEQALVCGLSDPWAGETGLYSFSYEQLIPNTVGGDGRFVPIGDDENVTDALELHSNVPFCDRGVLGRDDIGGARDEARCTPITKEDMEAMLGLAGDRVELLNEPLSDASLRALGRNEQELQNCAKIRAKLEEDPTARLSLEIVAAFEDRLALDSSLGPPFNTIVPRLTWQDLPTCLGDGPMTFVVRSQNNYTVLTASEGFAHNVIANNNGRCVVDAMTGPARSRRIWSGCEYKDDRLQLRILPFDSGTPLVNEPGDGEGAVLSIGIGTRSSPLFMNASQVGFGVTTLVPSRLRYSSADQQLYLVDNFQGGLIPIDLDPFRDTPITSFY